MANKIQLFFLLSFIFLFSSHITYAQGDLMITPHRIVFEGNKQIEEIMVVNIGQDSAFYSLSLIEYRMNEDGSVEEITEPMPGQKFAAPLLRYFPRSVQLAPRESQVVRMQVRRLPNMEEGEYRSHLYFRAVPKPEPLGKETISADTSTIGIQLTPIYGIAIPVIVRVGNLFASLTISNLILERKETQEPILQLVLNREGNQSVYGDITVDYVAAGNKPINIGKVKGVAVYTPNTIRRFSLPLTLTNGVDLNKGKLVIRFTSANEAKPKLFDEKELLLP
jgi:P pilus assembly chaperone PapD